MGDQEDGSKFTRKDRKILLQHSWPIPPDEPEYMLGFDAVVCVLRAIHVFLPLKYEQELGDESHRILQVARKVYTDSNRELVQELKRGALADLCPSSLSAIYNDTMSFSSLIDCEGMLQSFWSRDEYHLYGHTYYSAPDSTQWHNEDPTSPEEMARHSLAQYNGIRDLGDHISELWGEFTFESGWKILRMSRNPFVIRILYTPSGTSEPKRFSDMRTFKLRADYAVAGGTDDEVRSEERTYHYGLLAVVRLRSRPGEPDAVRLYDEKARYIMPPLYERAIVRDDWRLGDLGHPCMLFYLKTSEQPVLGSTDEVRHPNPQITHLAESITAACMEKFDVTKATSSSLIHTTKPFNLVLNIPSPPRSLNVPPPLRFKLPSGPYPFHDTLEELTEEEENDPEVYAQEHGKTRKASCLNPKGLTLNIKPPTVHDPSQNVQMRPGNLRPEEPTTNRDGSQAPLVDRYFHTSVMPSNPRPGIGSQLDHLPGSTGPHMHPERKRMLREGSSDSESSHVDKKPRYQ